jgi:hypothetical protein
VLNWHQHAQDSMSNPRLTCLSRSQCTHSQVICNVSG